MGHGKFQALFDKVKEKVDEKGGVKGIMSAWDKLGKDQSDQMLKDKPTTWTPPSEEPKKDNKMLIYLGIGAVVLLMLMKKK